jgi:PhnB protein
MRFITIFRQDPEAAKAPPPSAEEMAKHRAEMAEGIGKAIAAGTMHTTGGIGARMQTGGRITNKGGKLTVEAPPQGDGGWMAAGGFAIVSSASRETLIKELKQQILTMGEGSVEFCEYHQFYPETEASPPPASAEMRTVPLPGVAPYFVVDGAKKAAEFYAKAFGAKEQGRKAAEDGKRLMHCQMQLNGGTIMFCDGFPEYGHPAKTDGSYTMQLVVADGHVWWDRAIAAGCTVVAPYKQEFWGDMYGVMRDPFGIAWSIASPV